MGRISPQLPRFRGKHRAFLALFKALGLERTHVHVVAQLKEPVPYRVKLDLHSWLQRLAYVSGSYEPETVSLLVRLASNMGRPGYLLDIGANIGLISIPSALLLKTGHDGPAVISVEAVPDNAAALRHNVAMNAAERLVTVIQTGLGEREGTVDINVEGDLKDGGGTGTANILPTGSLFQCERISIPITTLDILMDAGVLAPSCSVIKIDTDGYDLKVLQGGIRFLAICRPVIFGEFAWKCLEWHGESIKDVVSLATSIGYEVWQRVPGKEPRFTREVTPETFTQDLLMVPSERVDSCSWCLG